MSAPGQLFLVGTPIGNLGDMTIRAIATLKAVDLIAAEDTRHSRLLCQHFHITTPLISYHQHNRQQRLPQLIDHLQAGQSLALISDAGMPGIADPGTELVQRCLELGIPVVPIPGVSACLTALVASGLSTEQFIFVGFLPATPLARRRCIQTWQWEQRTIIGYEAPHRLLATLQTLAEELSGSRPLVIARELTKIHEQFWRGTVGEAVQAWQEQVPKGEITLVLGGNTETVLPPSRQDLVAEVQALVDQGFSLSQACRQVGQIWQVPRQQVYQQYLEHQTLKHLPSVPSPGTNPPA